MDSREIVKCEIERERVDIVLNLLGRSIGHSSDATHVHADL